MNSFARFTGSVFIVLGLLLVILGWITIAANLGQPVAGADPLAAAFVDAISAPFRLVLGGAMAFQGLMLCAIGQVLSLMAAIAEDSSQTREYMRSFVRRLNQPKP
jgi:formate-dependent nitrite reductase membrane component NrfD